MKKQKGFSLIELLIVVATILVIASIAIPNFIRAKITANESSAGASLRTIVTSSAQYSSTYGTGYPAALANLGPPAGGCAGNVAVAATACLIDPVLATGTKSGYAFVLVPNTGAGTALSPFTGFEVSANPLALGRTGQRSFCVDQTGVIHFDVTGAVMGTGVGACSALPVTQVLQ
jgi:prepilin-type N-terminal cleavage/methylation domain-containing protein